MAGQDGAEIIRRMLKPSSGGPSKGISEGRAWRMSVPRVSEKKIGLLAAVTGYAEDTVAFEDILGEWAEASLYQELRGEDEQRGLAVVDPEALTALIDVQTMGRVSTRAIEARHPTAIDAALAGHVVEAWMDGVREQLGSREGQLGWSLGGHIPNARMGKLAIDEGVYRRQEVRISFGDGARSGAIVLMRPLGRGGPVDAPVSRDEGSPALDVSAEIAAVLCRTTISLHRLLELSPGDELMVPRGAVEKVRLETRDGQKLAVGRLGQSNGRKAVRLVSGVEASADAGAGLAGGSGSWITDTPPEVSALPLPDAPPLEE